MSDLQTPNPAQDNTQAGAATPAPVTPVIPVSTPDQLNDAAFAAVEAWQANPTPELKAAAQSATTKAKEGFAAHKKASEEAASKNKPPEKYVLKLPENAKLDAAHVEKVSTIAKERGLSQEQAQAMLERDNQLISEHTDGMTKNYEKTMEQWVVSAKEDKEIGGAAFVENVEMAKRVLDRFGNDSLKNELNATGFGNHPEVLRLLSKIGKAMGEDKLVIAPVPKQEKANLSVMYDHPTSKPAQ